MDASHSKIKGLLRDPDAILILLVVLAYLLVPEVLRAQITDRMDDPLVITLLGILSGGRYLLRATIVNAAGNVAAAQTEDPPHA